MNKLIINRLKLLSIECFKFNKNIRNFGFVSKLTKTKDFLKLNSINCQSYKFCSKSNENDREFDKLFNDSRYQELLPRNWRTVNSIHGVLLVIPRQKWGDKRMSKSYAEYQLAETIALINTLPNMTVIDTFLNSTLSVNKKLLFGSGTFESLKRKVNSNSKISAVVFGIDMLTSVQLSSLEHELGVEIFDRYSIVLNIFRNNARTKESKIQLSLAEIPYIRNNLHAFQKTGESLQKSSFQQIGGLGETWIETRKQLLYERETKLKKQLDRIKLNRDILRVKRAKKQFPVIAVVGYTNSGKTSLIKSLTNDERLVPKDQLFATLDVTVHSGRLPSNMTVLYTDTIGFISEIPTALINSFKATLSDICLADVIVHISDISHPNCKLQEETVHKTLDEIEVPLKLKTSIIEVANKIDLVKDENILKTCDKLLISATERIGLNELMARIETSIITNTGRLHKTLRVPNGGDQYQWLLREATVRECNVDPKDHNYLFLEIFITEESFAKFKHSFSNSVAEIFE